MTFEFYRDYNCLHETYIYVWRPDHDIRINMHPLHTHAQTKHFDKQNTFSAALKNKNNQAVRLTRK